MVQPVMQIVLDTSVYTQALQKPGTACAHIVYAATQEKRFEIVMTQALFQAIRDALAKLDGDLQYAVQELTPQQLLNWLQENAAFVNPKTPMTDIMFEAKEQPAMAALLSSGAACLVTADVGLASMHDQYNVVTPEEFFKQI